MKAIYGYHQNKFWWFRILEYGLAIKDIRIHPLTFSERNGYKKGLQIGNYRIDFITPISEV